MLALENEARIGKSKRKHKKRNKRFTASGTSKLPGEWSDLRPNTLLPQAIRPVASLLRSMVVDKLPSAWNVYSVL